MPLTVDLSTLPELTKAEIARHNSDGDLWITIQGRVYDLSKFSAVHPGGKSVLLKRGGTDATEDFEQWHEQSVLSRIGKKFLVGRVAGILPVETAASSGQGQAVLTAGRAKPATQMPVPNLMFDQSPFSEPAWMQQYTPFSPYYGESHIKFRDWLRKYVQESDWSSRSEEFEEIIKKGGKPDAEAFLEPGRLGLIRAMIGKIGWMADSEYSTPLPPLPCGIKPEEMDMFHCMILWDELSVTPITGLNNSQPYGIVPIMRFGSKELREKVVPEIIWGRQTIAIAITEPGAGSDVSNLSTTAKLSDDGKNWIINGEKKWITNGVWADWFMTVVRTGGEGPNGISILLVPRSDKIKVRPLETSGGVLSGTSFVSFENALCPVENVLGELNKGFKALLTNFNYERWTICVSALRSSRVCYQDALHYANKRRTFGKKLIDHAILKDKFAHMARAIESSWAWLENLTYQMVVMPESFQGERLGGPLALLKLQSTRTLEYCAREAQQILGGIGVTKGGQGARIEKISRSLRASAVAGGSEEVMAEFGVRQSMKVAANLGVKL